MQNSEVGINSVKLPESLISIGKRAFQYNALKTINIPNGVTNIDLLAFNGNCLETLEIPNSVTNLGNGAFTMNEISNLTLSNSTEIIPPAFAFNKLTTIAIPEGVTRIEEKAFSDNQLTKLNLPDSLKYLSGFNNNHLKTITIPKNVEEIGDRAFASNKMTSVNIPGNVKIIGKRAFWNTWHDQLLKTVTFEEGLEEIREFAFRDNELKDINIPSSLKTLDKNAFGGNLGHDKVVHLYTPNFKNSNNLLDSEGKHAVNPAKVIVKYQFEDKTLKEEEYFKLNVRYLHIGDSSIEITPNYSDNKYKLKDESTKYMDLINKENTVIFEVIEKEVEEDIRIKSIVDVGSVAVNPGTNKNSAIDKLAKKTFIIDTNDKRHEVSLNWTVDSYDENKSGEYQAVGTFELPQGILQSVPETKLEIKSNIVVKENLEDSNWTKDDFIYEGTILKGLSEVGKEKIKTVKDLSLPSENLTGQSITHIGASAFKELDIEKVILPKQIREIGALAFSKNKISYVDFPGTIERVENQAFGNNNIVDITFADGEGTICLDSISFLENKLTNVTILKEVKKVHEDAFKNNLGHGDDNNKVHIYLSKFDPENNGLFDNSVYHKIIELSVESIDHIEAINVDYGTAKENIDLPNKINVKLNNGDIRDVDVEWTSDNYDGQSAGEYIFKGSYDLPEIKTGEKVEAIAKVIVKEKPEEKSDFEFSNGTITKYVGTETDVKIPDAINGETVVAIGNSVFNKKGLTSVEIPSTVQTIGMAAFANNELTEVVLPTSLNSLGNMAFFKNKLTSLKINDGLKVISTAAFSENELTTVEIPESVTSIAMKAFMNNKLETVNIPTNVKDIGASTFENNNLSEIIIPKSIGSVGSKAFDGNINIKLKYTSLVEAIDIAQKVDITDKTEDSVNILKEAIELGKELNAKTNATLAEVNEMVKKINDAIEALDVDGTIEDYAV